MNISAKILVVLLLWAVFPNNSQAQQFSINSAGGCFEPETGIVKTNFWMFGELLTGANEDGEIANYNGFIPFAILENFTALGIEEQQVLQQLTAYPVPSSGLVKLSLNASENCSVRQELYDMSGQLVESIDVDLLAGDNFLDLNLDKYPTGNYLVRLVGEAGTMALTRVVKR